MRLHLASALLLTLVVACGGKQEPKKTPPANPSTQGSSTATPDTKPASAPMTAPASIAASTMAASAPTSMETITPQLMMPTTPPPEVEQIEYESWFGVDKLPAISSDGLVVAEFFAEGYDERDGTGDTVSLIFYHAADYKIMQRFDLLLPAETYSEDEGALKKSRATLLKKVAPRVEAAQKALSSMTWLPLEELVEINEGAWGREADPKALQVSFNADTIEIALTVGGQPAKTRAYPQWAAPAAPPCKDEDFQPGCGCAYPLILSRALYNQSLQAFLLSFEHMIDHQCEEPPANPTALLRYDASK